MSEADEALEWAEYAEEDLIMAKSALRRSKPRLSMKRNAANAMRVDLVSVRLVEIIPPADYLLAELYKIAGLYLEKLL